MTSSLELAARVSGGHVSRGIVQVLSAGKLPPARVRWIGPGYRFRLESPYQLRHVDIDVEIVVPEGFEFNAASVPRLAWLAISPLDLGVVAPLIHDWLYRTGGGGVITRRQADRLFIRHMKAEGVGWIRRNAAYLAVRVGGRSSWGRS